MADVNGTSASLAVGRAHCSADTPSLGAPAENIGAGERLRTPSSLALGRVSGCTQNLYSHVHHLSTGSLRVRHKAFFAVSSQLTRCSVDRTGEGGSGGAVSEATVARSISTSPKLVSFRKVGLERASAPSMPIVACRPLRRPVHGLSGPWRCSGIAAASHAVAIDASSTI